MLGAVHEFARLRMMADPDLMAAEGSLTPDQHRVLTDLPAAISAHVLLRVEAVGGSTAEKAPSPRELGRRHALHGLRLEYLVAGVHASFAELSTAVEQVSGGADLVQVRRLLTARQDAALAAAVAGWVAVDQDRARVSLRVLEVAELATTVSDLVRGVLAVLSETDGIAITMFARPTDSEQLEYEFGDGRGFDAFLAAALRDDFAPISIDASSVHGRGPIGRAWRTSRIVVSDCLALDPTAAPWRDVFDSLGWCSSASVPLQEQGESVALLSLQAQYDGFFATPRQQLMLRQLKLVLESALLRIERRPGAALGVQPMVDRAAHVARLRSGEVEMLFQPLLSLQRGQVTRVEALARLRGSNGLIPPATFLPAFGDEDLFRLFSVGLTQSLRAVRDWERAGLVMDVSVNLPVVAADDDRYLATVSGALAAYDVSPHRLTLELLETEFADRDLDARRVALERLAGLGVRLAQDDLGAGHSSLLRLQNLPFDEVKIDQSLLRGEERRPWASFQVVKLVADLTRSLGLSVVVEGLEDRGLVDAVIQLGVPEGQGYAIARPMPARDLPRWVAGYRLGLSEGTPRTDLGALAAHVAWEQGRGAGGPAVADPDPDLGLRECPLTGYLADRDPADRAAHHHVHQLMAHDPSGAGLRETRDRLARRLSG